MSTELLAIPSEFMSAINDAAALLDGQSATPPSGRPLAMEPLPSLLEQCIDLLETDGYIDPTLPIRTIHHFACTGGTLISKCLAAMPNTQLLGELHPTSDLALKTSVSFFPTDLPRLAWFSSRGVQRSLLVEIFRAGMEQIHKDARHRGLRLVLRDHSHSQYCVGDQPQEFSGLRETLSDHVLYSVVTVRHPLDSFLSLISNGWQHFSPFTVEEYALRYTQFLDHYADCEVVRYEDFVAAPDQTMKNICNYLELPFDSSFKETFFVFRLSGDSGRRGATISHRDRRPVPDHVLKEIEGSESWHKLCTRLAYNNSV